MHAYKLEMIVSVLLIFSLFLVVKAVRNRFPAKHDEEQGKHTSPGLKKRRGGMDRSENSAEPPKKKLADDVDVV